MQKVLLLLAVLCGLGQVQAETGPEAAALGAATPRLFVPKASLR